LCLLLGKAKEENKEGNDDYSSSDADKTARNACCKTHKNIENYVSHDFLL